MKLRNRMVGPDYPPYVIAEIGANHNGDMDLARKLIGSAKDCGCDAVKFQSWTPTSIVSEGEYERNQSYDDSPKKHFGSLREMVEKYYLRSEQHQELKEYCDQIDITFSSSPFSKDEADLLDGLEVPFFKIASMDIDNKGLLEYVGAKQKPVIVSTGMASLSEIEQAVHIIETVGNRQIVLLHCVSIYPPKYEDINLNNIIMLRETFGYPVGFSDHTFGTSIPLASVALGGCLIEKHFTLDKEMPGWDHEISADPEEMKTIVDGSKQIFCSLGRKRRVVSKAEEEKKLLFRRSINIKTALKKGNEITADNLVLKRPGTGIAPNLIDIVVGRKARIDLPADKTLFWDDLV
jgi:sialic acid synthase SpsE